MRSLLFWDCINATHYHLKNPGVNSLRQAATASGARKISTRFAA
jgi:hypothetical protein